MVVNKDTKVYTRSNEGGNDEVPLSEAMNDPEHYIRLSPLQKTPGTPGYEARSWKASICDMHTAYNKLVDMFLKLRAFYNGVMTYRQGFNEPTWSVLTNRFCWTDLSFRLAKPLASTFSEIERKFISNHKSRVESALVECSRGQWDNLFIDKYDSMVDHYRKSQTITALKEEAETCGMILSLSAHVHVRDPYMFARRVACVYVVPNSLLITALNHL